MTIAERNRKIKQVLTERFGKGKVTVRGSRGTAYGWVTVNIDYTPRDREHADQIKSQIWDTFELNSIKIGTYGYDDPGSDYGYGRTIHLNLNTPAYTGTPWNNKNELAKGDERRRRLVADEMASKPVTPQVEALPGMTPLGIKLQEVEPFVSNVDLKKMGISE